VKLSSFDVGLGSKEMAVVLWVQQWGESGKSIVGRP